MLHIKRIATGIARDMRMGFENVRKPIARAMYCHGSLSVVFIAAIGIFIGMGWVGIGSAIYGETGAWLGSPIGIISGAIFVARALDEL